MQKDNKTTYFLGRKWENVVYSVGINFAERQRVTEVRSRVL
jgi:hypothetical protein